MAFMDKISGFAKNVSDKTSSAIETEKLKSKIKNENLRIAELNRQLGALLCEKRDAGETFSPDFDAIFGEVDTCRRSIDDAEKEIQGIKAAAEAAKAEAARAADVRSAGGPACQVCGAANPEGTKFCSSCGAKLETPAPAGNVCAACGTALLPGAKFCPSCGARCEAPRPAALTNCPGCGKEIEPGTKFCPGCGYKIL